MKKFYNRYPAYHAAVKVTRVLQTEGYSAYFAGGCVRDYLIYKLKNNLTSNRGESLPNPDFDVATSAHPDVVKRLFPKSLLVGAQFGVVIAKVDGEQIEIATFRKDGEYSDGRRPNNVSYTDAQEDVKRRDFTINGLLYDPSQDKLIDYVGGESHIKAGIIKTIGDPHKRFSEDKLRLLRSIRFASRFAFKIDAATMDAIQSLADDILTVSPERIKEEWYKIFSKSNCGDACRLLIDSRLLFALSGILPAKKLEIQEFNVLANNFLQNVKNLDNPDPINIFVLYIFEIIRLNNPEEIQHYCRLWRFSKSEISDILHIHWVLRYSSTLINIGEAEFIRHIRQPYFLNGLEMVKTNIDKGISDNYISIYQRLSPYLVHNFPENLFPKLLATGEDLIKWGFSPSHIFKEVLHDLEDQQLISSICDKKSAESFVKDRFKNI